MWITCLQVGTASHCKSCITKYLPWCYSDGSMLKKIPKIRNFRILVFLILEIAIYLSIPTSDFLETKFADFYSHFSDSKSTKLDVSLISINDHYYMPGIMIVSGIILIPQNWPLLLPNNKPGKHSYAILSKTFDAQKASSQMINEFASKVHDDLLNYNLFIASAEKWQEEKTNNYKVRFGISFPFSGMDNKAKLITGIAKKYDMNIDELESMWEYSTIYTFPGTALIYKSLFEKLPFVSSVMDYPLFEITFPKMQGPF